MPSGFFIICTAVRFVLWFDFSMTSRFLNMEFNNVISGKLAPTELIINAMTGAMAIPYMINFVKEDV